MKKHSLTKTELWMLHLTQYINKEGRNLSPDDYIIVGQSWHRKDPVEIPQRDNLSGIYERCRKDSPESTLCQEVTLHLAVVLRAKGTCEIISTTFEFGLNRHLRNQGQFVNRKLFRALTRGAGRRTDFYFNDPSPPFAADFAASKEICELLEMHHKATL